MKSPSNCGNHLNLPEKLTCTLSWGHNYTKSFQNQQEYNSLQCTYPWAKLVHLVQASCLLNIASTYFLSWKCLQLSYMYPVNVAFLVYLFFRTKQSWFSSLSYSTKNITKKHSWFHTATHEPYSGTKVVLLQTFCSVYSHVHCYLYHGNLFSTENDSSMYIKDISVAWMFYPLRIFITTKMQVQVAY